MADAEFEVRDNVVDVRCRGLTVLLYNNDHSYIPAGICPVWKAGMW